MRPASFNLAGFSSLCAVTGLIVACTASAEQQGSGPVPQADGPIYGVYDPSSDFRDAPYVGIEHFFLPWHGADLAWLRDVDTYATERGRTVLVTLEPFSWTADTQEAPATLRADILAGEYDPTIDQICRIIGEMQSPVWVRWGHEMEGLSGRYPWAGWRPDHFVAAYRHVVSRCRQSAPATKFVWSPMGQPWLGAYYPGDDVVDIVGASLYGLEAYQRLSTGRTADFVQSFAPLYDRLAGFGKPIIIAELGFSGSEAYVDAWAEQAMRRNAEFPALEAVVYFNAQETGEWPMGFGKPDWRVYANIIPDTP
jgi:endoglucanase